MGRDVVAGGHRTVVGAHGSERMADGETVLSAYRRNLFRSVTVMLDSPAAFDTFEAALATDPTLSVDVKVSLPLLIRGIVRACVLDLAGGLLPAIRAARAPVAGDTDEA
jgi:hypothetical protein